MREIIFDTETTGLESKVDRVIEIGGIELINHFPTGKFIHIYINPQDRKVHPDALAVHGITDEFLQDKPVFADVVDQIREFFEGARWVAHNATFDMGFINAEFARLGIEPVSPELVTDTLSLARRKNPMGPNSLDALCRRYGIDNSRRDKHGALLDSELLAEVYIEMIGGRQTALSFGAAAKTEVIVVEDDTLAAPMQREKPLQPRLDVQALAAHEKLIQAMGEKAIWNKYRQ
ncbi:DNA polymerase III subunit epsilon [Agrobacterium larrymoorei]|uniref:DNA polymerase III subunit epsilon n=1 Tax=Agrobacterium larrymoorei TaxID=160699 RepID=A0A4D7DLK3_9HYPH|nr:DNA polymerase III subunit epsilon [Agrobacterium larrymoorei]QCI96654.1 DNA polymerase III subunit epsilon [Agrobacterium larrymoorei]QYA07922.1 DNA polymerase III subunit epsilon [Agrobacterium larrymoorei]